MNHPNLSDAIRAGCRVSGPTPLNAYTDGGGNTCAIGAAVLAEGLRMYPDAEPVGTGRDARVAAWEGVLKEGERAMLRAILARPSGITRAALSEACGKTMKSGTLRDYAATLVRVGLARVGGQGLLLPGPEAAP